MTRRSPRRGTRQAQLVEEFSTSHSSEEALYDAVAPVNLCVFSCPCMKCLDYQEITSYTFSISAMFSKRIKEMNQSPRETEQASEKYDDFHTCIYL